MSGAFSFDFSVDQPDSLIFSLIGYGTKMIEISSIPDLQRIKIGMEPSVENLQPIVVTGNREATLRTLTPIAISKISSTLLDETKPLSIYEAVNKTPGVMMVSLNNEQHAMSIRLPFTTSEYYLYLEDGLPIRPMGVFNHNALLEMNQFTVSSIEVVKGPVSSIYGPEAVGGAINFISQRPTAIPTARVGLQVDHWGYKRIQYGAGATLGKFGFYIGGLISEQKDSWITSSDYTKHAQYARVEYSFDKNLRLTGTFSWADYDSQTSGSADSIAFFNRQYVSTTDFTYRKSYSLRTRLSLEKDWSNQSQTSLTAFARDNKLGQNPSYRIRWTRGTEQATGEINSSDFQSIGLLAQHFQKFDFLNSKLTAGVHIDRSPNQYNAYQINLAAQLRPDRQSVEKYTITEERPDIILGDYDAIIWNTATYMQYDFNLMDKIRISAGIRYDRMYFDYVNHLDKDASGNDIGGEITYNSTTPKIGLTYDLGDSKGLYLNFSRGFAPSSLTAIFRRRLAPTPEGDLFYYNLVPATFNNKEVGGWAAFWDNRIYIDVSLYQMNGYNELLNIRQPDNSFDYQAAGKTLHQGIEYGITSKLSDQLQLRWGGTFSQHRFDNFVLSLKESDQVKDVNGKTMPSAPQAIWNTEVNYYPRWLPRFRTSVEWQHVSKWYQNQVNTVTYPGYDLINWRFGYKWKSIEVFSNIMNMMDTLYATNASRGNNESDRTTYTPAAPRTFVFGVQYSVSGK